jgi:pimeloyl-ACP methyl ester carboxylesterase
MKSVKDWKVGARDGGGSVATDFSPDSDVMLIAFGGLKKGIGRIAPFEFFNLTKGIRVKKIYVRDMRQSWYHATLPGIANAPSGTVDGVANHLKKLIKQQRPRKVVVVGNSAGGYAALLFGCLIGAHVVHAFAPQTFIDKDGRKRNGDGRWEGAQIRNAHNSKTRREGYFDLKRFLPLRKTGAKYHVHYQSGSRIDSAHAERMRRVPGVVLHSYKEGGDDHYLVVHLKKSGKLRKILAGALK